MAWHDDLPAGSEAYGIASSTNARIRVLAGPGTGKSFAMKRRVARLLEDEGVPPHQILAVTFTRVAAEDLHRELNSLGVPGADQLHGRTLHSLAMAILAQNHVLPTLGRIPRPLNGFELEPLLADLDRRHGTKYEREEKILAYGAAWSRLQTEEPGFTRTTEDQTFVTDLVDWLRFHHAMLMDELIPYLYQYLRNEPGAPERTMYRHVLVDEYQDLNRAEQEILHFLGDNGNICVIGDDDQSIYSFRNAHPHGIREWTRIRPADEHQIADCRRCPVTVVRMANSLIAKNTDRGAPPRVMRELAANGNGEVVVRQFSTAKAEAEAVVEKIAALLAADVAPGDIIVLTQRKTFAEPIFDGLRERDIPTKSYFAETELDTIEAQERFALLKLLLNNEDRVALRWLLGYGGRGWNSPAYRRIMEHVNTNGGTPWAALDALEAGTISVPYTATLVARFTDIKAQLAALRAAPDVDQFIALWLPTNPRTALLAETVEKRKGEAIDAAGLYDNLYGAITHPEVPMEVREVRIMSLHKSKGLSSPYVFIVGCVEGLLPAQPQRGQTPAQITAKLLEDRRLFYVGITRVKADPSKGKPGYLALTHARTMDKAAALRSQIRPVTSRGRVAYLQASRFFQEMAPHCPAPQLNTPL